jgi:short-subunit dehydrogenase
MPTTVITGASAGIGAALARTLAAEGHRLVLAARTADAVDAVAEACRAAGAPGALAVAADVTRRDDLERVAREAVAAFGGFDGWVNNAGRGLTRPVLALTDADVDEMVAVNVKSALYGMQVACAHFLAAGAERARGHVVNVSSFLARAPYVSARSAYSAAKAAVNSLSLALRAELAAMGAAGVEVSVVMPAMVRTDFGRHAVGGAVPPGAVPADAPPPQDAAEVAAAIAAVLRAPRPLAYTNPASAAFARRYDAALGHPDLAGAGDR